MQDHRLCYSNRRAGHVDGGVVFLRGGASAANPLPAGITVGPWRSPATCAAMGWGGRASDLTKHLVADWVVVAHSVWFRGRRRLVRNRETHSAIGKKCLVADAGGLFVQGARPDVRASTVSRIKRLLVAGCRFHSAHVS